MTTTHLDRPDPYRIRPKAAARRSTRTSAGNAGATDPRLETLRAALREMTHEQPEQARDLLAGLATDECLAACDPIAIDALAYLSSVTWTLKDPLAAMEMIDRAVELGPLRFAPNQKGGEIAWRLGLLDKAEPMFLAALRASEPGTGDAKASEKCLREVRRMQARGIRHGTRGISMGWLLRALRLHRKSQTEPAPTAGQRTA